MRLLAFLQGSTAEDQIGYHNGFEVLQAEGALSAYRAVPWRGHVAQSGWDGFCAQGLQEAVDFEPDAIYFQFFHAPGSAAIQGFLAALQRLSSRPVIAVSGGDAFGWHRWMKGKYPAGFLSVAQAADVTFVTAMGKCAAYLERENGVSVQILTEFTSVLSLQHATEPAYRISRRLLPRGTGKMGSVCKS
jgi:hypothetical protein